MSYQYISDVRYIVVRYMAHSPMRKTYWSGRRWIKDRARSKDFTRPLTAIAEADRLYATCLFGFVQYEKDVRQYDYNGPWPPV